MADNNNNNNNDTATATDIFQQQKKTIDTLVNVLDRQVSAQLQPVYVSGPAQAKPINYLLYAGIAIFAFMFLKKG